MVASIWQVNCFAQSGRFFRGRWTRCACCCLLPCCTALHRTGTRFQPQPLLSTLRKGQVFVVRRASKLLSHLGCSKSRQELGLATQGSKNIMTRRLVGAGQGSKKRTCRPIKSAEQARSGSIKQAPSRKQHQHRRDKGTHPFQFHLFAGWLLLLPSFNSPKQSITRKENRLIDFLSLWAFSFHTKPAIVY